MARGLYGWWASRSPWLRIGMAAALLLVSGILLLFGHFWIYGWAVGGVLLFFAFPNKAEQRGYHDF